MEEVSELGSESVMKIVSCSVLSQGESRSRTEVFCFR